MSLLSSHWRKVKKNKQNRRVEGVLLVEKLWNFQTENYEGNSCYSQDKGRQQGTAHGDPVVNHLHMSNICFLWSTKCKFMARHQMILPRVITSLRSQKTSLGAAGVAHGWSVCLACARPRIPSIGERGTSPKYRIIDFYASRICSDSPSEEAENCRPLHQTPLHVNSTKSKEGDGDGVCITSMCVNIRR